MTLRWNTLISDVMKNIANSPLFHDFANKIKCWYFFVLMIFQPHKLYNLICPLKSSSPEACLWTVPCVRPYFYDLVTTRKNCTRLSKSNEQHYGDVIMGAIASQITSLTIVYWNVYSAADQRKHQSSASLAFVWGLHRGPVKSPHKWPVTRKTVPFDDVIMSWIGATHHDGHLSIFIQLVWLQLIQLIT